MSIRARLWGPQSEVMVSLTGIKAVACRILSPEYLDWIQQIVGLNELSEEN